jgi:hypothetical protein
MNTIIKSSGYIKDRISNQLSKNRQVEEELKIN